MPVCKYCQGQANFTLKNGAPCCHPYANQCPVLRVKNKEAVTLAHREGRCRTDHLEKTRNWNKGLNRKTDDRVLRNGLALRTVPNEVMFTKNSPTARGVIRRRIIADGLLPLKCKCGLSNTWEGEPLSLHLEHRNGIKDDHRLENLCFLCPNCHSQTSTYCGRNVKLKRLQSPGVVQSAGDNTLKTCSVSVQI